MGLIEQIHEGQTQLVLALTGGGSRAISELLTTPGASRSILEAVVPYSPEALAEWLGGAPEQYCSDETSRRMAMTAYLRGGELTRRRETPPRVAGIGVTASLATDRPKRGPHRAHAALQTVEATTAITLELEKGRRSRTEEEELVARVALNLAAEACQITDRLPVDLGAGDRLTTARKEAPVTWRELLTHRRRSALARELPVEAKAPQPTLMFPGAFHPVHRGHRRMAETAQSLVGEPVDFELSIYNVDKPPLDYLEIDMRAAQFASGETLWLTQAPTFAEKAELFPGVTFVVGADTIARIANPRYYGGSQQAMDAAISTIAHHGCRFLVFGRMMDGWFQTLVHLNLPSTLARLCREVPESAFHEDISSTELRRAERDSTEQ